MIYLFLNFIFRHQNVRSQRKLGLQDFRGAVASGHHDYGGKDITTKLTMRRMDEGDASLVVSHHDTNHPDKSFSIEGRISGVRILKVLLFEQHGIMLFAT